MSASAAPVRALGPVTAASVTGSDSTSISLSWKNPAGASATLVRYAKGKVAPARPTAGRAGGNVAAPGHHLKVVGLAPGTRYTFSLFAADSHGHHSDGVIVPGVTGPRPVANLQATVTAVSIKLTWQNPPATSFKGVVVRYAHSTTAPSAPTKGTAGQLDRPKATSISIGGLSFGQHYSFGIWTYDASHRYSSPVKKSVTTVSTGRVTGHVTDGGNPVANVTVEIVKQSGDLTTGIVTTTVTDAAGAYSVKLKQGTYYVCFDADAADNPDAGGYFSQCYNDVPFDPSDIVVPDVATTMFVGADTTQHGINAALLASGAVRGTVVDTDANPVPFARVDLYDAAGNPVPGQFANVDHSGNYRITGVPDGTYTVCVASRPDHSGVLRNVDACYGTADAVPTNGTPVTVTSPNPNSVDLTMPIAGGFTGTITTDTGHPAQVTYTVTSDDLTFTRTDAVALGAYKISGLPAIAMSVCFSAPHYTKKCSEQTPTAGQLTPLNVKLKRKP